MQRAAIALGAAGLLLLLPGAPAHGEEVRWVPPPRHRLLLSNLLVLRLNPTGLEDQLALGYRRRLFERDSLLLRDTYVQLSGGLRANPAYVQLGPVLELQPVAVFNLRVSVEYVGFFGALGILQSFASPLDRYSDRALKERQDLDLARSERALHVTIQPLLQAKVGPIALRSRLGLEYWHFASRPGERVFYESTMDVLAPRRGWVLSNDLDLLYVHPNPRRRFVLGLRYSVAKALYSSGDFRAEDNRSRENNQQQRLGPMFAYVFGEAGARRFANPALIAIVNWYVDHRYRTGREDSALLPGQFAGSPAIPYVVVAFAFESDLTPTP